MAATPRPLKAYPKIFFGTKATALWSLWTRGENLWVPWSHWTDVGGHSEHNNNAKTPQGVSQHPPRDLGDRA